MLLRLLTFRPAGVGELADQYLRGRLADALREEPGLRYTVAGRGALDGSGGRRVVITLWDDPMPGARTLSTLLPVEAEGPIVDAEIELRDVAIGYESTRWDTASIVRVFRGRAQPGVLDSYLADVRRGTLDDVNQGHGPLGLFAAQTGPDEFVTVSVWERWSDVEQATGGNVRRPFATRRSSQLTAGTVEHLEVVPGTAFAVAGTDGPERAPQPSPVAG